MLLKLGSEGFCPFRISTTSVAQCWRIGAVDVVGPARGGQCDVRVLVRRVEPRRPQEELVVRRRDLQAVVLLLALRLSERVAEVVRVVGGRRTEVVGLVEREAERAGYGGEVRPLFAALSSWDQPLKGCTTTPIVLVLPPMYDQGPSLYHSELIGEALG